MRLLTRQNLCVCGEARSCATAAAAMAAAILCARETVRCESQRARGHLTSRVDGVAVREEAVKGIASISCPFNPHVIRALSMSCEDEDESVRRAAMRNLRLLLKRQEAKQV